MRTTAFEAPMNSHGIHVVAPAPRTVRHPGDTGDRVRLADIALVLLAAEIAGPIAALHVFRFDPERLEPAPIAAADDQSGQRR